MPLARVSAISGAAVSSNMGNKTTQTLSIVLTLFNVRLGRWVRNPRLFQRSSIKRPPALYLYFKELFAQASRDDEVVYLSDGGHFENLGVYELFLRRCRFIVAVSADAEDPKSEDRMGNLGNALRMGRVDFAVDVIFNDIQRIVRDPKTGKVECSFVVGELSYGGEAGQRRVRPDQIGASQGRPLGRSARVLAGPPVLPVRLDIGPAIRPTANSSRTGS